MPRLLDIELSLVGLVGLPEMSAQDLCMYGSGTNDCMSAIGHYSLVLVASSTVIVRVILCALFLFFDCNLGSMLG